MKRKCEANMCDGSGLRQAGGWHLLSPCYCAAGRQIARQMGAQPETRISRKVEVALRIDSAMHKAKHHVADVERQVAR